MKTSRRPVLLSALSLLLALPAGAAVRSMPTTDGPPAASIEGTITSVNIPFVGGGPIVTLLDGLVSFDATGATVRFADGLTGTPADLATGQRIVAFVEPATALLKATSVVVLAQRTDVLLTGKVEAVDTAARTLTLLGFTARVTDKTVFGGPRDGVGQSGLGSLRVGDLVLVAAKADSGSLVATRVMQLSPSPDPAVRLHGLVEAIGTESWTILVDGSRTVVKIGDETKVIGDPKVGDEVDVLARRQSDAALFAVLISKSVPVPALPTVRYQGIVKAIGTTSWTIGPKVGDGPDRLFAVNERTKVLGDPKVGDEVGVLAQHLADGPALAIVIAKVIVAPPTPTVVSFDGVVVSITPGTPAGPNPGTTMGTWLVGETKVVVSRMTVVRGDPRVGDEVHVVGLRNPDGVVLATSITKR
jgi:hypothetical protein